VSVQTHFGQNLLHRDDLGFNPKESIPLPFGKYFYGTCAEVLPRRELPAPRRGELPPFPKALAAEQLPALPAEVPADMAALAPLMHFAWPRKARAADAPVPEFDWRGGEAAAIAQLEAYLTPSGLGSYHRTRNQLQGAMSFSRVSPWLANGCISARTVYWRAKEFERANKHKEKDKRFDHVHKFIFQLCWRDYFRLYVARFGTRVFFVEGPARRGRPWRRDVDAERRWKEGQTGVPLVDALMRELRQTGFMANRGRYIVASYLVFYLGIDWRVGADWFESLLLDHDVYSNYGEWASMANVAVDLGDKYPLGLKGRGPSSGRLPGARGGGGDPWAKGAGAGDAAFDPWEQALHYDKTEAYTRKWVPEVRMLPTGSLHHVDSLIAAMRTNSEGGYPQKPLAVEQIGLGRWPLEGGARGGVTSAASGDDHSGRGGGGSSRGKGAGKGGGWRRGRGEQSASRRGSVAESATVRSAATDSGGNSGATMAPANSAPKTAGARRWKPRAQA